MITYKMKHCEIKLKFSYFKILVILLIAAVSLCEDNSKSSREIGKNMGKQIVVSSFLNTDMTDDDFGGFNMDDLVFKDNASNSIAKTNKNDGEKSEKLQKKVTKLKITSNYKNTKGKTELKNNVVQKSTSARKNNCNKVDETKPKNKKEKNIKIKNEGEKDKESTLKRIKSKIIVKTNKDTDKLLSKIDSNFLQNLLKLQANPIFSNLPKLLSNLPNSNTNADISNNNKINRNNKITRIIEKINQDQITKVFKSEIIDDTKIKNLENLNNNVK